MKIWIASAVAAIGLAAAPQASADDGDYLRLLEDSWVLNHYGPEVLLREGHKVCDSIQQGMTDSQAVDMVSSDLPESSAAIQVVTAAKLGLGC
jgi:Protein of unknown function (DUF732)